MRSKHYQQLKKSAPTETVNLDEAISWLKENTGQKFDATIELHFHLGIDPAKSDQMVRGQVNLPAGAISQPNIVVFTDDSKQQKAVLASGAKQAGGEEVVKEIASSGHLEADVTIATPSMMPKVAQIAKVLGPKGLMPNPKTGTVTDEPEATLQDLLGGKVSFKMDQQGNIHQAVAKTSWEADKIKDNTTAFINAVKGAKPDTAKGEFIKSISIKSTMSPAIRITTS